MSLRERRFDWDANHFYTLEEMRKIDPDEVRRYRELTMQSDIDNLRKFIGFNRDDPKSWDWMFEVAKECLKEMERKEYFDALAGKRNVEKTIHCKGDGGLLIPIPEPAEQDSLQYGGLRVSIVSDSEHQIPATSQKFSHSEDYRSVCINGKGFTLTLLQARIVEILHHQYKSGLPEVSADYVMEKGEAKTSRLKDSFRKNEDARRALIARGKRKGTIKLNIG